jgi:mono/diheme cytochrome c family protein
VAVASRLARALRSVGVSVVAAVGVAVVAAVGVAGCTSPGDDPGLPVAIDPAVMYAQMCARCHGPDGHGDPQIRQQLPVRDFSDPVFQARASNEDIQRVIMTGKNQMPSCGGMISQPKIQSLSGYVRRLGKKTVLH